MSEDVPKPSSTEFRIVKQAQTRTPRVAGDVFSVESTAGFHFGRIAVPDIEPQPSLRNVSVVYFFRGVEAVNELPDRGHFALNRLLDRPWIVPNRTFGGGWLHKLTSMPFESGECFEAHVFERSDGALFSSDGVQLEVGAPGQRIRVGVLQRPGIESVLRAGLVVSD